MILINKMIEIIKSINLDNEINIKDIYELFKTESSSLNSEVLSNIQKYKNLNDFIDHYSKIDFRNVLSIFGNLESLPLTISNHKAENIFNNKTDKYLFEVSQIILSLLLIEKTNKLLNSFISTAKSAIKDFYSKDENNSISLDINNCLNNILNYTPDFIQRSLSRRGTKEKTQKTNITKSKRNSLLSENNSDETKIILIDNNTPRFKEKELSNQSSVNDKKEDTTLKDSEKSMNSTLSLKNMKFLLDSDDINIRGIRKKNKTMKFGFEKQEPEFFFKQKSNSNRINEYCDNSNIEYNSNNIDKSQVLADLFNTINCLFERNKINLEQKLALKQLLISDSESVMNRLFEFNETNFPFNTNLKSLFKKFLISELKNI